MAEYRIVARIDPQTAAGAAKVKQDLRGVDNQAKSTGNAINAAFDQAKFDKSVGGLTAQLERLNAQLENSTVETTRNTQANTANAKSQAGLEAAMRRVLGVIDAEAAEQHRLNALLADAKSLLDAGKISTEQYAQVQQFASAATKGHVVSMGQQRQGMIILGEQFRQFSTSVSTGANVTQAFAQQVGQAAFATQFFGGKIGAVGNFLAGPWGIALIVGTTLLAGFANKWLESGNEIEKATEKLKKDAKETEATRIAKEAFAKTLEGQIALQRQLNEELDKGIQTQRQQQQLTIYQQRTNLADLRTSRTALAGRVQSQQELVDRYLGAAKSGQAGQAGAAVAQVAARQQQELDRLTTKLTNLDKTIADAERGLREAQQPLLQSDVENSLDAKAAAADRYQKALGRLNRQLAIGAGNTGRELLDPKTGRQYGATLQGISPEEYKAQLRIITKARDDAEKAAASVKAAVSVFKSREQAIGLAGRELQSAGFRVSENVQFGGVHANHPGMGNANHGRFAIDVNAGAGVTEANVPDLRAKFDAAAKRYQARGYRVLWDGWVYEANENGRTRRIPSGENQHYDHMHLEAPSTIVGKATQSSTEAQAIRDEKAASAKAGQMADFVSGIVDKAAGQGLAPNRATQLQAGINTVLADFQRRFDQAASPEQRATITKALTEADARQIAQHFDEAYVKPLERLQELDGTAGQARAILNKELDETARLGRELTPVEKQQIENSVKQGDLLEREASILENIKGPLEDYKQQIAALNDLLAKGQISQTQYNSRIAQMGQEAVGAIRNLPGLDPNSGQGYGQIGAIADEQARFSKQLDDLQSHREALLQLGINYDAAEEAAYSQHIDNLRKIDQARKDQQLQSAEDIFGSLTSISEEMFGKQSKIWRAMFTVEKAVAIARSIVAIQTGIAEASALPFPANLGAIASVVAATASIVSNIRAVTLNFADGGLVSGPGTGTSDSIPARLSNGEFVVRARATKQHRQLLEAINAGATARQASAIAGAGAGGGGAQVVVTPTPAPNVTIRSINVLDPSIVGDYLATPEGEQTFVNLVNKHPELIQHVAQGN